MWELRLRVVMISMQECLLLGLPPPSRGGQAHLLVAAVLHPPCPAMHMPAW